VEIVAEPVAVLLEYFDQESLFVLHG